MTINNTKKEYLEKLIADLVKNGEDKEELSMWVDLYDLLSPEEREALVHNLEKELGDLQKLN
ncbi:hypothetical protein A2356_01205 [Candidatus Nomurabacteria bacterium RIFOXYB1_FULL_39_16]|nr:MAG: hypothetical protein A2356_01205 [Candidatus Nomurabacteria bacterium RIFOXYB1_FULL_39_16]OGJ14810.1 MAG: hypothetical protein A2585_04040 [Candidatus Nomurabacteria bacterium RIFOXYD1_FULL_39_12]